MLNTVVDRAIVFNGWSMMCALFSVVIFSWGCWFAQSSIPNWQVFARRRGVDLVIVGACIAASVWCYKFKPGDDAVPALVNTAPLFVLLGIAVIAALVGGLLQKRTLQAAVVQLTPARVAGIVVIAHWTTDIWNTKQALLAGSPSPGVPGGMGPFDGLVTLTLLLVMLFTAVWVISCIAFRSNGSSPGGVMVRAMSFACGVALYIGLAFVANVCNPKNPTTEPPAAARCLMLGRLCVSSDFGKFPSLVLQRPPWLSMNW
jgi:hypothetical protein